MQSEVTPDRKVAIEEAHRYIKWQVLKEECTRHFFDKASHEKTRVASLLRKIDVTSRNKQTGEQ
jgi:hypothetical protein